MLRRLGEWAAILGADDRPFAGPAAELRAFVNTELWDRDTGFFYDIQMVRAHKRKIMTFEGFWPLALKVAEPDKLQPLLAHLFDPTKFFGYHPVATVAMDEPEYSKNCWRGPAWNCINFWITRGCAKYGLAAEARRLAERVLDATAARFAEHETLFEFYNSGDESMTGMARKQEDVGPCRDYLGHNPLNAIYWTIAGLAGDDS